MRSVLVCVRQFLRRVAFGRFFEGKLKSAFLGRRVFGILLMWPRRRSLLVRRVSEMERTLQRFLTVL